MTSTGSIFLQKRSKIKEENTGMYDKTIGGHVVAGDSANMTVVKECAEELGFPAVVTSESEFLNSLKVVDLSIVGLFRQIDYVPNFISERVVRNNKDIYIFKQPQISTVYYGYYDGPIKFQDGEASGIEVFPLNDLREEVVNYPDKFTKDLSFMLEKY
jgi:isopentenyldiphosphate isomerase